MTGNEIDDEMLMAYADGELDASDAARVETVLRDDPDMAERLVVFTGTREVMRAAADVKRAEPVPEDVVARAKAAIDASRSDGAGKVLPFRRSDRPHVFRPAALAASLAIAGFLGGYLLSPKVPGDSGQEFRFAILDTPGLSDALRRVPAGERMAIEGGEIAVIASFRDADGAFCREFELDASNASTLVSVACWSGTDWDPRLAVVATADDETQYAPASSLETLDTYLTAIGAGAPLSPEDEASALAAFD